MKKAKGKAEKAKVKPHRYALIALGAMLLTPLTAPAAECPAKQPKTQQALFELKHNWAKALEKKDAAAVDCILAPEFVDTGVNGEMRHRQQTLAAIAERKDNTNELQDLTVTMLGDVAVVHGANHVRDRSGKEVAVVRFTDVFAYRDGRWKAVSGHESLVTSHK